MSETNAAATLSLKIDTGTAAADLAALRSSYAQLKAELGASLSAQGAQEIGRGISQELAAARSEIKQLRQEATTAQTAYAELAAKVKQVGQASSEAATVASASLNQLSRMSAAMSAEDLQKRQRGIKQMSEMASAMAKEEIEARQRASKEIEAIQKLQQKRDIEMYEVAATEMSKILAIQQKRDIELYEAAGAEKNRIAAIQQRRDIELFETAAAEKARLAAIQQRRDIELYEVAAAEKARLSAVQQKRDLELYQTAAAEKARLQEIQQRRDIELYEAAAAQKARIQSLQEKRDIELFNTQLARDKARAEWASKSQLEQLRAALPAARALASGANANLAHGEGAIALANQVGGVKAVEDAIKQLSAAHRQVAPATLQSAAAQVHWNHVANEGHALARGLSGALGTLWITYGSLVPLIAGAALAGSLRAVYSTGKDLEYQLTIVQAVTGEAATSMQSFGDAIRGSMFAPTEAVQGFRALAQAGLTSEQALQALPAVLKLATVGETDMANAAKSATSIMHTFGKQVGDISHIGDVFAKAAAISATSVTEMMEAMKQAAAISNVFGVSMEETAAALATLANRGIEGSAAGTAIRNMIKEMASPATEKAANAMKQFGINVFNADGSIKPFSENLRQLSAITSTMSDKAKANFLEDLFNERGAKAANILLTDLEKMKKSLEEIQMSSDGLGFMTEAEQKIAQSVTGLSNTLKSEVQLMFGEVFQEVEPQIKSILSSITELTRDGGIQDALTSLAQGVANATVFLIEHGEAIKNIVLAYAGFKILSIAGSALVVMGEAVMGATAALTAMSGAMGPVAAGSAATLASTLGLVTLGVGAAAVAIGALIYKVFSLSDEQDKAISSIEAYADANKRLLASMERNHARLIEDNRVLDEQIRLMKEGKSAADALAEAKAKAPLVDAQGALSLAKAQRDFIKAEADPSNLTDMRAVRLADEAVKKAEDSLKRLQAETWQTLASAAVNKESRAFVAKQEQIEGLNKTLNTLVEAGNAAQKALQGVFEGPPALQAAQRKNLQGRVTAAQQLANIAPLGSDASPEDIEKRKSLLSAQSTSYGRVEKGAKKNGEKKEDLSSLPINHMKQWLKDEADSIKEVGDELRTTAKNQKEYFDSLQAMLGPEQKQAQQLEEKVRNYGLSAEKIKENEIATLEQTRALLDQNLVQGDNTQGVRDYIETLDQMVAAKKRQLGAEKSLKSLDREWSSGWKKAYAEYQENATNAAQQARDVFNRSTESMADAITRFSMTGKLDFKSFASSVIEELIRIQAKMLAVKAMGGIAEMFGWGRSNSGLPAANTAPSVEDWAKALPNAKGNAFSPAGIQAFANGGAFTNKLFSRPTMFAHGGGFGVMGEAGPEAVMPLARDSQGRLGVRGGGSDGGVVITNNITISSDGNSKSDSQVQGKDAQELAKRIDAAIVGVISREKLPGGLLYA